MEQNYVEWHEDRLIRKASELGDALRGRYLSGERLEQVQRELSSVAFEMAERLRETREQEIEEAWSDKEA